MRERPFVPASVIFLDWSQYGAPGWTEAFPGVDLSDLIGG